jgi:hypothetical protein
VQAPPQLVTAATALAELATYRDFEAGPARPGNPDRVLRKGLEAMVRDWSVSHPFDFTTAAATRQRTRAGLHREHVVPVRVLVDRMLMDPAEVRPLLEDALVLALVTEAEHRSIGTLSARHPDVYARMLKAPVSRLPRLGMERYRASGITLVACSS